MLVGTAVVAIWAVSNHGVRAQDAVPTETHTPGSSEPVDRSAPPITRRKPAAIKLPAKPKPKSEKTAEPTPATQPAAPSLAAAAAPPNAPSASVSTTGATDVASSLERAGAGGCAPQINALASATMGGVVASNTAAHWAKTVPERRVVNVLIGQKYANAGVPFGVTGIFAGPNDIGTCDAMSVQVLPSPLSCAKIQAILTQHGRQIGDLAGLPLIEDATSQTILVPTGADSCVLVGTRTSYAQ